MSLKISSKEEFELMFKNYIAPLLGLSSNNSSFENVKCEHKLIKLSNQKLYFYESLESDRCFAVQVSKKFPKENLNLLRTVYSDMIKVKHKNYDDSIRNKYDSLQHLKKNYEYQLQKSLLNWFSGSKVDLLQLMEKLERWKEKTYEGKKVPFAFLIDLDADNVVKNNDDFEFMAFLDEEYSATFSDGITSIIELDSKLNFVSYKSITDKNESLVNKLDNTPYRFSQIIETFTKSKIAIFLLVNGDIVLVKNCEILLVKREGKWLNFNKKVFKNIISAEIKCSDENFMKLLDEIYLSALDVSFAHSGGIIACVRKENVSLLTESSNSNTAILNSMDNLLPNNIVPELKPNDDAETKKRYYKRNFLLKLINDEKFFDLDRKKRSELISMDGAAILNFDGSIISFGAIIQNDSGSYGGGRGTAAKKLSKYGFAIKISTDGYVEVYINERIKYRIK